MIESAMITQKKFCSTFNGASVPKLVATVVESKNVHVTVGDEASESNLDAPFGSSPGGQACLLVSCKVQNSKKISGTCMEN